MLQDSSRDGVSSRIGWKKRCSFYDGHNVLFHMGTTEDCRIPIGGGKVEYLFSNGIEHEADKKASEILLHDELSSISPLLVGVEFEHVWGGSLGVSLDSNASVGVTGIHESILRDLAYSAHGVLMSFLFGKVIADPYGGKTTKWDGMPFLDYALAYIAPEPIRGLAIRGYGRYLAGEDSLQS